MERPENLSAINIPTGISLYVTGAVIGSWREKPPMWLKSRMCRTHLVGAWEPISANSKYGKIWRQNGVIDNNSSSFRYRKTVPLMYGWNFPTLDVFSVYRSGVTLKLTTRGAFFWRVPSTLIVVWLMIVIFSETETHTKLSYIFTLQRYIT